MKKFLMIFLLIMAAVGVHAVNYPINIKVLDNGLKVIVCEMPSRGFVQSEIWYRVGSNNEKPGIRGIAHMFEHMMFRGSKKYPGSLIDYIQNSGISQFNAYTSYDRTVYYEYATIDYLDTIFDLESDRMANLILTQDVLNTEREVVAEEYSNGMNNWYQRMNYERYKYLYPEGHPYQVDVIGEYNDIINYKAEDCLAFYNNYYSPNNAFLVVAGDVKSEEVFKLAEKYFGGITKQLDVKKKTDIPTVFSNKIRTAEIGIDFPVQIYSFVFPRPAADSKDARVYDMLISLLFSDNNSIINERIVNKEKLAYGVLVNNSENLMYDSYTLIDVIMAPMPGNVKVKKEIREEINKVIASGIAQEKIDKYVKAYEAAFTFQAYEPSNVAYRIGLAEFYFGNPNAVKEELNELKKIKPDDLKNVALKYFSEEVTQFINIKPSF
jgi:zinc protease